MSQNTETLTLTSTVAEIQAALLADRKGRDSRVWGLTAFITLKSTTGLEVELTVLNPTDLPATQPVTARPVGVRARIQSLGGEGARILNNRNQEYKREAPTLSLALTDVLADVIPLAKEIESGLAKYHLDLVAEKARYEQALIK